MILTIISKVRIERKYWGFLIADAVLRNISGVRLQVSRGKRRVHLTHLHESICGSNFRSVISVCSKLDEDIEVH
jgi:hypothetical protein